MAVAFRIAGALAANATTTTLNVVAPTTGVAVDDIFIAAILCKDNLVISVPANWTKFVEVNNGTAQRLTLAWKRVVAGDAGATFAFTKPTDNNLLFCGLISAYSGAITTGSPIDAAAPTTSANASSDTVTYATFNPTETAAFVVAVGVYNNDLTTAGAISGSDPTFANNWDLETGIGSDGSIFGYSGGSSGAATGARSHSTTSTLDDVNIGALFGLVAPTGAPVIVLPGLGALAAAGFAALIALPIAVRPGLGAASATGFAPTIQTPRTVAAGLGAASATGLAPTITVGVSAKPGVGLLTAAGFVPLATLSNNQKALPGVGAATCAGAAPAVAISNNQKVLPGVGVLSATGFGPTVPMPRVALPGAGAVTAAGFAPKAKLSGITIGALPAVALARLTDELVLESGGVMYRVTIAKVLAAT